MRLLHFSLHSLTWLHELAAFGRSDKEQVIKNKTPFTPSCHFERSAEERSAQSGNLFKEQKPQSQLIVISTGVPRNEARSGEILFQCQLKRRFLHSATPALVATVEMTKC